jgi:hypothetical protein
MSKLAHESISKTGVAIVCRVELPYGSMSLLLLPNSKSDGVRGQIFEGAPIDYGLNLLCVIDDGWRVL